MQYLNDVSTNVCTGVCLIEVKSMRTHVISSLSNTVLAHSVSFPHSKRIKKIVTELIFILCFLFSQYQQGNRTVAVTVQYTTAGGQIIEHSPDDYSYIVEQTGVINVSLSDFPSTTRIFGNMAYLF